MRGWRICKLAGIDVEINYSWLFILVLLVLGFSAEFAQTAGDSSRAAVYLAGVLAAAGLFGSLLAHELAHSLAAQRYGVGVARITLFLFGGVAQTKSEAPTPAAEIVIAGMGPLLSLSLAGVFLLLAKGIGHLGGSDLAVAALWRLGTINGLLAVFNLLPAFPLDGGRLLRAALWEWWGDLLRGTRVATTLGRLCGHGMVAWGLIEMLRHGLFAGLWFVALGWLLAGAAQQSYRTTRLREALRRVPLSQAMQPLNFAVPPELRVFAAVHRYFMPLRLPALVVATEGQMVGVLTAEAARRLPEPVWTHLPVGQVMQHLTSPDMVLPIAADLGQALDRMLGDEQQCLLVVDEQGALAGVLTPELLAQAAQMYGRA